MRNNLGCYQVVALAGVDWVVTDDLWIFSDSLAVFALIIAGIIDQPRVYGVTAIVIIIYAAIIISWIRLKHDYDNSHIDFSGYYRPLFLVLASMVIFRCLLQLRKEGKM